MGAGDWWRGYFDADFLRIYEDFLTPERTRDEVAGLLNLLQLRRGARVLDLACGWGRHSVALAEAGMRVTGVDLSPTLLERARRDADEAGVEVEWVQADMRELPWEGEFDAVLSLFSSIGLFDSDAEDGRVLRAGHRALRPGGLLLVEAMHRDQVVAEYAERDWWETEDGTTVWMEREWDAVAGVSEERLRWRRGRSRGEKTHRIRVRSATEWDALLRAGGFRPLAWWGDWEGDAYGRASEQMIVLARAES
jgi:ubiquinone/menaquinone biosynthesis C-methylase UbiE